MKVVKHRDNQKTEEKTERKTRIRCKTQKLPMSVFAYLKRHFLLLFPNLLFLRKASKRA